MPAARTFGKRETFGQRNAYAPAPAAPHTEAIADKLPDTAAPPRWPLLTTLLTLILILGFFAERSFSVEPESPLSVGVRTSVAVGGVGHYLVLQQGEWWRIFTSPWLHGSLDHLTGNVITLLITGTLLERLIGRSWLAALFMAGAAGGSIGSLAYGKDFLVSVGASGAIMCLLTILYTVSYHYAAERHARRLRRWALVVLVPALIPTVTHGGAQIDVGAHFGGAVVGIAMGFVLLALWDEELPSPPFGSAAAGIAVAGILATVFSFAQVAGHYGAYAARSAALVPSTLIQDSQEVIAARSPELAQQYPRDPSIRMNLAISDFDQHDYRDAETELRTGLAEHDLLSTQFSPSLEPGMQMLLAISLVAQNRVEDARPVAKPICSLAPREGPLARGYALLMKSNVCS